MGCRKFDYRTRYMNMIRLYPLSETISDMEELFDGDLILAHRSQDNIVRTAKGRILNYKDQKDQSLFVYIGLITIEGDGLNLKTYYPSFFFGTDLENTKLEEFLRIIKNDELDYYFDRKNVIKKPGGKTTLMTCVESHKMRKMGLYNDVCFLPIGSRIVDLKGILDA